jgi:peptidoglycan/LPS O-acetylase OafA/YrhL
MNGKRSGAIGVTPSSGSRLAGIEGLRAIAASSVLIYHVWLYSNPNGRTAGVGPLDRVLPDFAFGVILFFTLSGFLLYRPFARPSFSKASSSATTPARSATGG